jgi:predicted amidohydrolase YtcJ
MKKNLFWLVGILVILIVAGFFWVQNSSSPNKVIYGGTIYTMEGDSPKTVEAVAISGDKIVFAGTKEEAKKALSGRIQMVDLHGKTMFPGFIDPHIHHAFAGFFYFLKAIRADEDWNLPGVPHTSPVIGHDQFLKAFRAADAELKDPKAWLIVMGYASYFHGKIDRSDVEKISSTRPIILLQRSGHEAFLNGKALELLGFTAANTKGNPDIDFTRGHFVESAVIEILMPKMLPLVLYGDRWEEALKKSVEYLHNNGITTVGDMLAIDGFTKEQVKAFHDVIDAPDVPLRTYMVAEPRIPFEKGGEKAALAYINALPKKNGNNLIYLKAMKGFVDGAFFAQLMRMKGGYTDGHQGEWIIHPAELKKIITVFYKRNYPLHIHVNGDDGMDSILATFADLKKKYPKSTSRVFFHHCGYVRPDQIKKMHQLGIGASLLPYYLFALGEAYSTHGFGPEKASRISAAGTMLKNGIVISLHSDFCMSPSNPLNCAWVSVNRIGQISRKVLGPEEKISIYQALQAITIGSAYTLGLENEIGSIKPGKKADFTILALDPFKIDPMKMRDIKITDKFFNGKYYALNRK